MWYGMDKKSDQSGYQSPTKKFATLTQQPTTYEEEKNRNTRISLRRGRLCILQSLNWKIVIFLRHGAKYDIRLCDSKIKRGVNEMQI